MTNRNPNCEACELHKTCKHVCLWGEGPKKAKVMFIGEAPGAQEDHYGRPFVGESGQILRNELVNLGLKPEEVYITNVVKCRPPKNDKPSAKQVKACRQYLDHEIATVQPEYIVTLGSVSTKAVLKKARITEVHGQIMDYQTFKGMGSFHPAYVLRDPTQLPVFQKDLRRLANAIKGKREVRRKFTWRLITPNNIEEFFQDLFNCEWYSFDTETSSLDWFNPYERWISCLNMSFDKGGTWVLPMRMPWSPYHSINKQRPIIQRISSALWYRGKKGVAHNGKYDNHWLYALFDVRFPIHFDTMLASHTVDENSEHGLDSLATRYLDAPYYDIPLNWKQGKFKPNERTRANVRTTYRYGAKDAFYTLWLKPPLEAELSKDSQVYRLFNRLVMRAAIAFERIEENGLFVLPDKFKQNRIEVVEKRDEALAKLTRMSKVDINWNSPQQVADLLFRKLKLPVIEKTAKGAPSTGEATLLALKDKHPVANQLVKYRELEKFLGTYLDGWKSLMRRNLVYFSYKLHGTVTGRYASRLHQTPRDGTIRNMVSAPPGWTFVQGDFSQAELRVAAILSGDPELMYCFKHGIDVHWRTLLYMLEGGTAGDYVQRAIDTASYQMAKKIKFPEAIEILRQMGPEKATKIWPGWKEARKRAKAVNFGFIYGMMEKKFIETAKMKYGFEPTEEEATIMRRMYFQLYSGLTPWHNRARKLVKLDGYIRSLSGRVRRLPGITSKDQQVRSECERQAINSPVQGFIGDYKAMALVELNDKLDWERSRIVGEHHDAILFWVRTKLLKEELPKIRRIMREPELVKEFGIELPIPIEVDLEVGPWGAGETWKPGG